MKSKILTIFIFLITLTILFMSGYYFYYQNNKPVAKTNHKKQEPVLKVEDYVNYELSNKYIACQSEPIKETIVLPNISYKGTEIDRLNNKIQSDFKTYIDYANKTNEENLNGSNAYNTSYEYYDDNNYLSIIISYSSGIYCSTIKSEKQYYVYDKINDKYLSKEEVLSDFNVEDNKIKEQVALLSSDENIKNELIQIVDNNTYGYYIENNQLIIQLVIMLILMKY